MSNRPLVTNVLVACVIALAVPANAQQEIDLTAQQQAIEALSFMFGEWHGEATMRRGPEPEVSQMVEKITPRLDGTLLLIEGHGTARDADGAVTTAHEAVAVVWFDEAEDRYRMKTFIPGRTTNADFELTDSGIVWGFDTPGGSVRYTATFTDDTWTEQGEFSRDGETWMPFLEMTLERTENDG